ncbi:hypothetical protein D3C75_1171550 [compost metagenome]
MIKLFLFLLKRFMGFVESFQLCCPDLLHCRRAALQQARYLADTLTVSQQFTDTVT